MRIKKWVLFGVSAILIASCKDREIQCVEIGTLAQKWRVHELYDTLHFVDQLGNDTSIVISTYYNSPTYTAIQKGTFLKKQVVCQHEQHVVSEDEFFHIRVTSSEAGSFKQNAFYVNKPTQLFFSVNVGDAIGEFDYLSELDSIRVQNENTTYFSDFVLNGTTYESAIVVAMDTMSNTSANVKQFVCAANEGLVQFSTRFPQRVWTRQ
ncbi:MAG: hypothetical protein E6Q37_01145 [Crocinitomicaceae bacterium]|nr:MAG: hypothetical protein E6Q37_01145 [Crocinitomicaceae bacterium]